MKKQIKVTHKEEYSNGKKTQDYIIISQTYLTTLSNGIECVTQGGLISIERNDVQNLIKQLQALTPTPQITQPHDHHNRHHPSRVVK